MYCYSPLDKEIVRQRALQFRDQTNRFLNGELSDEEYLPLRLQNGVYRQRHAHMLRIAIPYGEISSLQLKGLATIADKYDKGWGHFTTRQNIQLNWINLECVPSIIEDLSKINMHAIQASGNCIRNITADHFAGVAEDEDVDPRPYAEIIRQWSSSHPEFSFLPRKFKIAVNGSSKSDRAATFIHDIGLQIKRCETQGIGFEVRVGGGLGRTAMIGQTVSSFVKEKHILSFLEAILRIYNLMGRRDNKYKARIKILIKSIGIDEFKKMVYEEWHHTIQSGPVLDSNKLNDIKSRFREPVYITTRKPRISNKSTPTEFLRWKNQNTLQHKHPNYAIAVLTLKQHGRAPGDASSRTIEAIASLSEKYSQGVARVSHHQNIVLPYVHKDELLSLWTEANNHQLTNANHGLLTDIICCPGGDFCNLAQAKSIPIARAIQELFSDLDYVHDIGDLKINISGCMNACGHHHVGDIGILGVDKKGEAFYQVTIGGSSGHSARISDRLGAGFSEEQAPDAVKKMIETYCDNRLQGETFLETYLRIGISPFKERIYGTKH